MGNGRSTTKRTGARSKRATTAHRNTATTLKGKKVAILIAGMHRTGTSAVTRTLSLLGCDLPKTLLPASPGDNDLGFWESQAIHNLNEEILASAGSAWNDWAAFNPGWHDSPVVDKFRKRARVVLKSEFGDSRLFVLKDPRICRLLGFWIEAVKAFGAQPRVVLPIRNPFEVAASLERRNGMDPSLAHLFWLRHVLDAEAASRHLMRSFVRYDDLLAGWQAVTDRIGKDLRISWPRRSTPAAMEIEEFLSPAQRHHVEKDETVLRNPSLSQWIRSSFEILDRWAHGNVQEMDTADLDRIRAAFDEATPAFARSVAVGQQAVRRSRTLERTLAALEKEKEAKNQKIKTLEEKAAEAKYLAAKLQTQEAQVVERQGQIASLNRAVEERDLHIASLNRAVEERDLHIAGLNRAVEEHDLHIASLHQTVTERDGKITSRDAEIVRLKSELAALEKQRNAKNQQIRTLEEKAAEAKYLAAKLQTQEAQVVERQGQIASLNRAVEERDLHIAGLNRVVEEHDLHIASLHQTVTERDGKNTSRDAEIVRLKSELAALEKQRNAKNQQIRTLEEKAAKLGKELSTSSRRIEMLVSWIGRLEHVILALLNSRRWKTGNMLGEVRRRLLRKPRVTMPVDVLSDILNEFSAWKKNYQKETKKPQDQKVNDKRRTPTVTAREDEAKALRQRVSNPQAQLSVAYAFRSWRLTGPVRAIGAELWRMKDNGRTAKAIGRFALTNGLRAGYRLFRERRLLLSSGAFDVDYYRRRYPDVAAARMDAALHYLLHGAADGRDPSPHFASSAYLVANPDVATAGVNPLVHYLRFGMQDGRPLHLPTASENSPTSPASSPNQPPPRASIPSTVANAVKRLLKPGDPNFNALCEILGRAPAEIGKDLDDRRRDLQARLENGVLGEMVARAGELDPLIHHSWQAAKTARFPPFHSEPIVAQVVAMHRLQSAAARRRARAVVVIPHCRLSGATRIAAHLATALAHHYGPDEIVILRTDLSDMKFPEWFPDGCRHVDFAGTSQDIGPQNRQRLLVEFVRSLRPETVFNVNSYLFWQVMGPYGRALSRSISLYAYLFCNDKNAYGHWDGYPVKQFYRFFDTYSAVITDSHYLADELRTRYRIPPAQADKLVTLETPISKPLPLAPCPDGLSDRRRQVFWAGRFDRQKRVDVVLALASRLPGVDFHLWGEPVLDKDFQKLKTPRNVILEGVYRDFNELQLERSDLWLYTSQWDGVPNILLEIAAAGIPLVASLAGGTGEVLVEGLCHRIANVEDINAFEAAIRSVLDNPKAARERAAQLRELILARRTPAAYQAAVEKLVSNSVSK